MPNTTVAGHIPTHCPHLHAEPSHLPPKVSRFLPVAPALVRTLRAANAATQTQALCDALACTQALAGTPGGMERLLRAGAAPAVVGRLAATSRDRTIFGRGSANGGDGDRGGGVAESKAGAGAGGAEAKPRASPEGLGSGEVGDDGPAERAEALAFAFVGRALEASGGNCLGTRELTAVAEAFRDDPTPAKFSFMNLLLRWAALQEEERSVLVPREAVAAEGSLGAWTRTGPFPAALRERLLQALHGAADDERRDSALALLALLLQAVGQEWAVEDAEEAEGAGEGSSNTFGGKRARKRGTFVAFAVRCTAGEVRILLDEALSLLVSLPVSIEGAEKGLDTEVREKARGPMGPAGVDPSIGMAAEIAAASAFKGGNGGSEEQKGDGGGGEPALSPARAPLPAVERKALRQERTDRLLRMVPVGLGIAESTIAFLCGGGSGKEEEERGEGENAVSIGRWEELPIETLHDLQKVSLFHVVVMQN